MRKIVQKLQLPNCARRQHWVNVFMHTQKPIAKLSTILNKLDEDVVPLLD